MGQEIWYRGEAVGVSQEAGKTNPHDFVDGMYLSDRVDVAAKYAELRTADPNARRVWSAPIDLTGLKVLDLTTDKRWEKFLAPADPRLPHGETLIKQANENYGRLFKQFVAKEKIDLNQYDVVIGKEYVRGGRQLCVLHKQGVLSPLATRFRAKFRAVASKPSSLPSLVPRGNGRIGPGLKAIGGTAAMIGLSILIDYIWGKILGKILEEEMRKLEPTVRRELSARTSEIAQLLADGQTAFAIVHIVIAEGSMRSMEGNSFPLPPKVEFIDLRIGTSAVNSEGPPVTERSFRVEIAKHDVTYSFAAELPQDEVDLYRAYRLEMQWYDEQLSNPSLADQDLTRLVEDRRRLADRFAEAMRN